MDASRECFSQMVSPREWKSRMKAAGMKLVLAAIMVFKYENTALETALA